MDAEFRLFLRRFDKDRKKADEDRQKADEDRRKADEDRRLATLRFEAIMARHEQNDLRIEKLMERSDRREKELAQGLAKIGKRIIDTQMAILSVLRVRGNGRAGDGNGPRRN